MFGIFSRACRVSWVDFGCINEYNIKVDDIQMWYTNFSPTLLVFLRRGSGPLESLQKWHFVSGPKWAQHSLEAWSDEPEERPSPAEIVEELKKMQVGSLGVSVYEVYNIYIGFTSSTWQLPTPVGHTHTHTRKAARLPTKWTALCRAYQRRTRFFFFYRAIISSRFLAGRLQELDFFLIWSSGPCFGIVDCRGISTVVLPIGSVGWRIPCWMNLVSAIGGGTTGTSPPKIMYLHVTQLPTVPKLCRLHLITANAAVECEWWQGACPETQAPLLRTHVGHDFINPLFKQTTPCIASTMWPSLRNLQIY